MESTSPSDAYCSEGRNKSLVVWNKISTRFQSCRIPDRRSTAWPCSLDRSPDQAVIPGYMSAESIGRGLQECKYFSPVCYYFTATKVAVGIEFSTSSYTIANNSPHVRTAFGITGCNATIRHLSRVLQSALEGISPIPCRHFTVSHPYAGVLDNRQPCLSPSFPRPRRLRRDT